MKAKVGRFQGQVGMPTSGPVQRINVAGPRRGQFMRVFNPKDTINAVGPFDDFKVQFGSTNQLVSKGSSIDFVVANDASGAIRIAHRQNSPTNLERVRGVYDTLGNHRESRSGRFKFDDMAAHVVIDLSQLASSTIVLYRFLNSGDHAFSIMPAGASVNPPVLKRRTFDIAIPGGTVVSVQNSSQEIEGIYEMLEIVAS